MRKVAVIMGSDSDLPVVEKAMNTLSEFAVPFEVHVFSAHRTPVQAKGFSENARKNGFGVIIAAAGMAAHLAGAIAANTTLPVIGIPVKSTNLDGMDALLSTVQMPSGIPVATVAINGAANAAMLAIEMLAIEDATLAEKLSDARRVGAEKAERLYFSIRNKQKADRCVSRPRFLRDPMVFAGGNHANGKRAAQKISKGRCLDPAPRGCPLLFGAIKGRMPCFAFCEERGV